jgi:hypothetical protein
MPLVGDRSHENAYYVQKVIGNKWVQLLNFSIVLCTVHVFKTGRSIVYSSTALPFIFQTPPILACSPLYVLDWTVPHPFES